MARAVADGIRGARLRVLPGAGHVLSIEQLELFCQLVAEFLAEHDSP